MPEVAVRRRADGRYLVGSTRGIAIWSEAPKFLPSETRARLVVRVDLGQDLRDFEFVSRDQAKAPSAAEPTSATPT